MKQLVISKKQWHEMRDYVDLHFPLEACGLLAGKNARAENVIFIRNQAQSPVRFVMEPREQLQALHWIESSGLDLLAIFHSHPTGPETLSATDIAEAAYEVIHLIWSRRAENWTLRGFSIENGQVFEVSLLIEE